MSRGLQRSPYSEFAGRNAQPLASSPFGRILPEEELYAPLPDDQSFGVGMPPWAVTGG